MPKIIIYVPGKPIVHGYKRREFIWSEPHKCHVYMAREYELSEFNEAFEKAMKNNRDMNPMVRVIELDAAKPAPAAAAPLAPPPIINPVATISAHEVTVEEAEEVLLRLAPDRLKKKAGPKHSAPEQLAV
jgi:hypothetical protein